MKRILVIGTDPTLARRLQTHRPLADCQIDSCPGNVEALRNLRARSYDVLVTDPDTTCHEDIALLEEVDSIRPGIRVIARAPTAAPQDIIRAMRSRVFACYSAPFDEVAMTSMIETAVESGDWHDGIELTSGLPFWITLRVTSRLVSADRVVQFMKEYRSDLPAEERDELMIAFREVLVNAMEHGAGFDPEKVVEVSAARTRRAIVYHFRDPGRGFDPSAIPHAAVSNPPDDPLAHLRHRDEHRMRVGGFGILLAKQLVDEMVYNECGNEVLLIKYTE
jgi:anti-sigma regulatory factor (Ser/Thr protein kinase)